MHQLKCIRNCWVQMWFLLVLLVQIWYCSEKDFYHEKKINKMPKKHVCLCVGGVIVIHLNSSLFYNTDGKYTHMLSLTQMSMFLRQMPLRAVTPKDSHL